MVMSRVSTKSETKYFGYCRMKVRASRVRSHQQHGACTGACALLLTCLAWDETADSFRELLTLMKGTHLKDLTAC